MRQVVDVNGHRRFAFTDADYRKPLFPRLVYIEEKSDVITREQLEVERAKDQLAEAVAAEFIAVQAAARAKDPKDKRDPRNDHDFARLAAQRTHATLERAAEDEPITGRDIAAIQAAQAKRERRRMRSMPRAG